jgi:hypothetical protein
MQNKSLASFENLVDWMKKAFIDLANVRLRTFVVRRWTRMKKNYFTL